MFKQLLGHTDDPTKLDVVIHVGAAVVAVLKAYDKFATYKSITPHQGES